MTSMKSRIVAGAGVALLALGMAGAANAQPYYAPDGSPAYGPAPVYRQSYQPLTVTRRYAPVAPAYNPYVGPKAVFTAPIATAGTLVALPFRMVNAVFPARGNPSENPLVLVGAPVHAAGQVAQLPFQIMQAPFGGPVYTPY